jgi:hypothetical protein
MIRRYIAWRDRNTSDPRLRLSAGVDQLAFEQGEERLGERVVPALAGPPDRERDLILYTSNGEVRQEFSIVLTARSLSRQPTPRSESSEVRWAPAPEVAGYTMDRSMRIRINDFLARNESSVVT